MSTEDPFEVHVRELLKSLRSARIQVNDLRKGKYEMDLFCGFFCEDDGCVLRMSPILTSDLSLLQLPLNLDLYPPHSLTDSGETYALAEIILEVENPDDLRQLESAIRALGDDGIRIATRSPAVHVQTSDHGVLDKQVGFLLDHPLLLAIPNTIRVSRRTIRCSFGSATGQGSLELASTVIDRLALARLEFELKLVQVP